MTAFTRGRTLMLIGAMLLSTPSSLWAIASRTEHLHGDYHGIRVTTWNAPGGMQGPEHQHRDRHPLNDTDVTVVPGAGDLALGFHAYACWDNREYRYDAVNDRPLDEFAHGFIDYSAPVRYKFLHGQDAGDWDTDPDAKAMKAAVNAAFGTWETAVNETLVIAPQLSLVARTHIDFQPVAAKDDAEITVRLAGINAWQPATKKLEFRYTAAWDFDDSDGITAGKWDFESIALHEIGHVLGLHHFGADRTTHLMSSAALVTGRDGAGIDAGSLDGAKDLYTIMVAVPEPLTVLGVFLSTAGLAGYVRKRAGRRS